MALPAIAQPFEYQSGGINFHDWLQLITLCLAPLVLHVVAGVPDPTVLGSDRPRWWNRLPFFNPVSILWRYHAIADRRARLLKWNKDDMAISNAVFWTDSGKWKGSESLLDRGRGWITKRPLKSHVSILSASTLTTLALTLQGVQAALEVADGAYGTDPVNRMFSPVALFGLLRLPAALWLSSDYGFAASENEMKTDDGSAATSTARHPISGAPSTPDELSLKQRLRRPSHVVGVLYRVWWTLSMAALFLAAGFISGTGILWQKSPYGLPSTSAMVERVFYLCLSAGGFFIHAAYVVPGRNTTTVLPCIQKAWYTAYTWLIIILAIAAVVVSSLETHRCRGGIYTTYKCSY